jgi:NADPH-dependent curcumin reductase CurA
VLIRTLSTSRQWRLAARPAAKIRKSDFELVGVPIFDYADRYPEAVAEMARWLADGRLRSIEDTVRGDIDAFPTMLERLFTGENTGKLVLELQQ